MIIGNQLKKYTISLVAVIAAFGFYQLITHLTGHQLPDFIIFYPAVLLVAVIGGFGTGLFATFVAVFMAFYFIFPPQLQLVIDNPEDVTGLIVFSGMGVFISIIAGRYHLLRDRLAEAVADRTTELKSSNELLKIESQSRQKSQESLQKLNSELLKANEDLRNSRVAALNLMEDAIEARKHEEQSKEKIRESQQYLIQAQAIGNMGSWRMDVQKNELIWSDENYEIFGVEKGTPLTYESFVSIVHPDDREHVDNKWKAALDGEPYDLEHRIILDGQVKWVREKANLEFDENNELVGGFGITQDITERKQMIDELHQAKDQLELRVQERTAELDRTITALREEALHRIAAEQAVKAERKRFEDVLEAMPAYAILLTEDYHLAYANKTFRDWFGDDNGKKCYEFLFDRTEPCENCETYNVLKTGKKQFWEWTGPNGHNYDIYDYPFTDTDGKPLIMEIGVDVTAHKQAQKALLEGQERYRSLTEATSQIVWTTDAQGQVVSDMPSWREFTGQTVEQIMGWGWINSLHPEDRDRTAKIWSQSVSEKSLYETEYRILSKDGQYRYMSVRGVPVIESDGSIREWVGTCTDITLRRQMEDELRSASLYARSLLEASLDPLVTISPEGKITDVNEATVKATGFEREEIIGTDYSSYFTEPQKAEQGYMEVFAKGYVTDYPLTIRHKDGHQIDVLYNATVYKDAQGKVAGVFAAARDVTEKKAAEADLEKYRLHLEDMVKQRTEELFRSNKDLEQFAYVASHDLQEPLRAVAGFTGLLRMMLKDMLDEEKLEYMNFITEGVERMQSLINGLLEYSRIRTGDTTPELIDSKQALDRAIANLRKSIEESGVKIIITDLPKVYGNSTQLTQLFQNLIGNAVKFRRNESPEINISAVKENNSWRFALTDNGIGMEPQYFDRIFQIFQRLHNREKYSGTGIGLSICKKIVDCHGGKIWVESRPGQGSTFYFTIPDKGN